MRMSFNLRLALASTALVAILSLAPVDAQSRTAYRQTGTGAAGTLSTETNECESDATKPAKVEDTSTTEDSDDPWANEVDQPDELNDNPCSGSCSSLHLPTMDAISLG